MASMFDKERLVLLERQQSMAHPIRDNLYRRPPYVSAAFEEYRTEQERASDNRETVEVPDVAGRILSDRFDKIARSSAPSMIDATKDEQVCIDTFFSGTAIKKPCAQTPFSDSIVNPLRRRNNDLIHFQNKM
eukprot:g1118.t1